MQVFSCEIFEILKNTQFEEHPPPIVSPTANITKIPRFNLFFTWKKKILGLSFLAGWGIYLLFFYCVTMATWLLSKHCLDVVVRRCSAKKVFLKVSQNSQENAFAKVSFLIKLQTLLKKRLWHRCFPVNFCEIFKNTFFIEHLQTTSSVCFSLGKIFGPSFLVSWIIRFFLLCHNGNFAILKIPFFVTNMKPCVICTKDYVKKLMIRPSRYYKTNWKKMRAK